MLVVLINDPQLAQVSLQNVRHGQDGQSGMCDGLYDSDNFSKSLFAQLFAARAVGGKELASRPVCRLERGQEELVEFMLKRLPEVLLGPKSHVGIRPQQGGGLLWRGLKAAGVPVQGNPGYPQLIDIVEHRLDRRISLRVDKQQKMPLMVRELGSNGRHHLNRGGLPKCESRRGLSERSESGRYSNSNGTPKLEDSLEDRDCLIRKAGLAVIRTDIHRSVPLRREKGTCNHKEQRTAVNLFLPQARNMVLRQLGRSRGLVLGPKYGKGTINLA